MLTTNFDLWTYRDLVSFARVARTEPKKAQALAFMVVTSWDYDTPLEDGAFLRLWPLEAAEAFRLINEQADDFIKALDLSVVTVDFKAGDWRQERFLEFNEALEEGNTPKVEMMVREVISMAGFSPSDDRPLTAGEGARFVRAIITAWSDVVQGKA